MEHPVLIDSVPKLYENEVLFLKKNNIKFTIDERSHDGIVYLTSLRLVLVAAEYSFDIPLANIKKESMNQPIFSPINISGDVTMINDENITKKWKINFYNSANTLIYVFTNTLEKMRNYLDKSKNKSTVVQTPISAFIDPNDSSVLYVSFL